MLAVVSAWIQPGAIRRRAKLSRCVRVLAVLIFACVHFACYSLDRKAAESALLLAQVEIPDYPKDAPTFWSRVLARTPGLRSDLPVPLLYIMPVGDDNERLIRSNRFEAGLFIFQNLPAGKYRIHDLVIPRPGPTVRDGFGRVRSLRALVIPWNAKAMEISQTEALAGVGNFMGSYRVRMRSANVGEVSGEKDSAGERAALQRIIDGWSGDWADLVGLQSSDAY